MSAYMTGWIASPLYLILIPACLISIIVNIFYALFLRGYYLVFGAKSTSPEVKINGKLFVTAEQAESGNADSNIKFSELKLDGPVVGDIFGFLSYTVGGWTKFWYPRVERHKCPVFAVNAGVGGVACLDIGSVETLLRDIDVKKDQRCLITHEYPFQEEVGMAANFFNCGDKARSTRDFMLSIIPTSVNDEQFQRGILIMKAEMMSWSKLSRIDLKKLTLDKAAAKLCLAFAGGMLFGQALDEDLISAIFPIPYILLQHPMVSPYLFPQYYTAVEAKKELFAQAKTSPYWSKITEKAKSVNFTEEVAFNTLFVAMTLNAFGLSNIMINSFYLVSQLPQKGKGLFTDEAFFDSFAWEMLRCTGPAIAYKLKEDKTISTSTGEHFRVAKGTRLMSNLCYANRDGTVYSEPHVFKMDRFNPLPPRDLNQPRPRATGNGLDEPMPTITFGCPLGHIDDKDAFHRSHQCVFRHMAQPFCKEFVKIILLDFQWELNEETNRTMKGLHLQGNHGGNVGEDLTGAHYEFDFHPNNMFAGDQGGTDTTVNIKGGAWFEKFHTIPSS